ncbi:hypothetical protein [Botrimarina sp.]|uniref:hypothetical protein n=1 Tax=Botrimarina sp. TaxID=2795802 RepID=UPI0032EF162E
MALAEARRFYSGSFQSRRTPHKTADVGTSVAHPLIHSVQQAGALDEASSSGLTEDPLVSSDILRDPRASVVDLNEAQVTGGDLVKVMSWYDNEWGYASQMVRYAAVAAREAVAVA